jgi:hypothetical protein
MQKFKPQSDFLNSFLCLQFLCKNDNFYILLLNVQYYILGGGGLGAKRAWTGLKIGGKKMVSYSFLVLCYVTTSQCFGLKSAVHSLES